MKHLEQKIFEIQSEQDFNQCALEVFHLQAVENPVYRNYLKHLGVKHARIESIESIPFLPIDFFKEHRVISGSREPELVFESSGTTGLQNSRHYISSEKLYQRSFKTTFHAQVGNPEELCILALLPSYLERGNSSLVYMMDHLISLSKHKDSGFYLDELDSIAEILHKRNSDAFPTLLLGVSFALLDLAEQFPQQLKESIRIMETGGMKGRRKEIVREELHSIFKISFGTRQIWSEYGMTELLSQAYSKGGEHFRPPDWMKVFTRDIYDPISILPAEKRGAINVIDLANLYSCSFIATSDLGIVFENGEFGISGRMDQSEIRGCNLLLG